MDMISFSRFLNEALDKKAFDMNEILPPTESRELYKTIKGLINKHIFPYKKGARSYEVVFNANDPEVKGKFEFITNPKTFKKEFSYLAANGKQVKLRSTGKSLDVLLGKKAANAGMDFEHRVYDEIRNFIDNGVKTQRIDTLLQLTPGETWLDVSLDGGKNTRRPLAVSARTVTMGTPNHSFDIGAAVTDVTVTTNKRKLYLSLKSSLTYSMCNAGISKILPPDAIKSGEFSPQAQTLLRVFSIDPTLFSRVFNEYKSSKPQEIIQNVKPSKALETFLRSAIGSGYVIVHDDDILAMSPQRLFNMTTVQSVKVRYPIGKAARVEAHITTSVGTFVAVFRSASGKVYPDKLLVNPKGSIVSF